MTTQWRPIEELRADEYAADGGLLLLVSRSGEVALVGIIPCVYNGHPGFEAVARGAWANDDVVETEVQIGDAIAWMPVTKPPTMEDWLESRRAADAEKPEDFEGAFAAFEQERQEKAALMASGAPEPDTSRPIDPVERPAHYCQGAIETIDYIESLGIGEAFCQGNAIKYLSRYRLKGGVEDLRKARWYVDRLITLQLERKP